ncbi:MAG: Gfo/Idh/MocA family oxidoreductase [Bacteroidota bacterium]
MAALKGVCIGAGYFSQFHFDAWTRIPNVKIVAVCDTDKEKAQQAAQMYDIPAVYEDYEAMFAAEQPDFVDIITPPATHEALCKAAGAHGIHIICQKPMAPTFEAASDMVAQAEADGIRLMIHENFRFQPWHREIKKLLDAGAIGDTLHSLTFRSRMGDGWGEDAYLGRQPYFRTMPRLLVYETGVHFIDTFCFLAGQVEEVYAHLRRLNPVIAGEDCGLLLFKFSSGALGMWDANRYNASANPNARYTFGTFLIEGSGGSIRLYDDGKITIQQLGDSEAEHSYAHVNRGFGGDCCFFTQRHFVDCLEHNKPFETSGEAYLNVLRIQEAIYKAANTGLPVRLQ